MSKYSTTDIEIILDDKFTLSTDLSIRYEVTKSRLALPNSAKIEVYNLSYKTYQKLIKQPKIVLKVDGEKLYQGKIINVNNPYEVPNWHCTMYCSDIRQRPASTSSFLNLKKGTSNTSALESMTSLLSSAKLDTSAFSKCAKSKGSLLKQMMVEYKKEEDIIKAMQNMFKGCDTEVFKEDGVVKLDSKYGVRNATKPIVIKDLLEPPTLSNYDIELKVPLHTGLKLGLGFKVLSKSINKKIESPYLHKQHFNNKVFKVTEFTHKGDNFSKMASQTDIKGMKI